MQARTLAIIGVLLELKHAFMLLLKEKHKHPALLNIYSFIDICAALANESKKGNAVIFQTYIKDFAMMAGKPFSPYDLWAARSSLLHAYSPLGDHTKKPNGAQPIFYYSWPERREDVEAVLQAKGYTHFILLEVEDIQWVAIDAFNSLLRRIETDATFEERFLNNAQHFLFDLHFFKLESELAILEELAKQRQREA